MICCTKALVALPMAMGESSCTKCLPCHSIVPLQQHHGRVERLARTTRKHASTQARTLTVISRMLGNVRTNSRMGPVRMEPGSALMKSFGSEAEEACQES